MFPPHLEAAFSFGHVLLGVEEDDVDLGHVEHPQRHGGRQAERDGQGGSLDIHLGGARHRERERDRVIYHISKVSEIVCVIAQLQNTSDEGKGRRTDGTRGGGRK